MTGILDEYPGAAAAYSLRLLNTDYTGDAVIVRRASDNTTQNIGFVDGELDTDALNTFCSGTDGFVATWYDQSGNGYNATQTTASQQPKIFDDIDGVILNNGKPSIETDGVDDLLDFGQSVDLYSLNSEWSVFMNYQIIDYSLQAFQRVLFNDSSSTTGNIPFGIQLRDNGQVYFFNNGTVDDITVSVATQNNLTTFIKTSSDVFFKINNVSKTSTKGTIDFTTGLENTVIGSSPNGFRPSKMYVSELIIYPNNQSSNRTGIETNINDFYSIY